MKRILVLALSLAAICGYAQKVQPEEIPWMVVRSESPEWYARQVEAWEEVVAREPQNENAWYNLSKATKYANWDSEDGYARRQALYERMSKAIPDTYTYHFCAYDNYNDSISNAHMERAYQLMPKGRIFGEEYGSFIAYFWKNNKVKELKDVAQLYYREQSVPSDLLRYNYNELQCLPPNAIYFGNGDAILLPKIALQYGMDVHQDKMVICASFLYIPEYYNYVCKQLGIEPEQLDMDYYRTETTWNEYLPGRIRYIIQQSGHPAYLSPASLSGGSGLEPLKEHLYNEGLVLRYSEMPYDNYARVRENLEQNIRLDYLVEPDFVIEPEWQSANSLAYNYFVLLTPLIAKYREWNNPQRSEWLKNLLTDALAQSKMRTDLKKKCQEYLNKYSK